MKGSDREFSYSDSEWMKIKNIVKFGTNRDADEVRVPRSYILHSPPLPVSLKSALELSALTIFAFKDTLAQLAKQRAKSAMVVIPLFEIHEQTSSSMTASFMESVV